MLRPAGGGVSSQGLRRLVVMHETGAKLILLRVVSGYQYGVVTV